MGEIGESICVLLADDHPAIRVGLRAILDTTEGIEVIAEAEDGTTARALCLKHCPHILLLDLHMPGPRPAETVRYVREHCPGTAVLVLTAHDKDAYLATMVESGVAGFMVKDEAPEKLVEAVRRAASGELLFRERQFARAHRWQRDVGEKWAKLTPRELEVLQLIVAGHSNQQIAELLTVEECTVETHVGNLLRKLQVHSRVEAAAWVWKHRLVEPAEVSG